MNFNGIYNFILSQSANSKDSKILLKELLELDNFLYSKISSVAVQYGHGSHPKHQLTKYHDFFVNNINEKESVLDLGCGRGDVAYSVAKKTTNEVIGIEIKSDNIKYASSVYIRNNLTFIKGDLRVDIPQKHFDVVILSNVLEHLTNRDVLLKNIVKLVTPIKILLRVPCFEREWIIPMKKELNVNYFLDSSHYIEYKQEEFIEEMNKSGLNIISTKINWGEIWAICEPVKG